MDEPLPTPTPPWVSEDLPEGNWHIDADFLKEAYTDLEHLAEILKSDTVTETLDNIFEEECDCGSLDGAQSDPDEMEETFCPDRSNFKSDYNRTFLILEQMLPRLKFAKQKIDTMIDAFTERAKKSRERWEGRVQSRVGRSTHRPRQLYDLPVEVISSIIAIGSPAGSHTLFAMSRVNRALRGLIFSMPLLWADLHAMEGIAKTKIQLERSRDVSLMVNMSIWPLSSEDDMEEKLSRFITLLEPERHRIRRLVIEPFRRTWMISATAFIREATFQRLEALHLGYAEEDGTHDLEELTIQGPIRELRLRRTPVLNGSIGLALPQLERLSLEELNITANSMQDALLTMTGLRSLTMIDVQFSDTDPVSFNQIPLPHLRYLSVRRSATQVVIPHLETPSLITLYIDNLCLNGVLDPAEGVEAAILVAIARSNSQLRQLHAEDCYMAPDAWTEVFRSLPELEYLHIRGCGVDKTHLSALAWLRTETRGSDEIPTTRLFACPNLEEIVFENELSLTSDVVREIVEARASVTGSRGVGSISWITFWGCDSDLITDEDVHVIAGLTRGISCDLVDGNDIWEDSEDSYVESGDDWKCSDWELEDSSSEASDE